MANHGTAVPLPSRSARAGSLAQFFRRTAAYGIDILLAFMVLAPLGTLVEWAFQVAPVTGPEIWLATALNFSLPVWTYFTLSDCCWGGATVGKRLLRLSVVRLRTEETPEFGRALLRTAVKLPEKLVRDLQDRFPQANLTGGDEQFENLVARVVGFVEAPGIGLDLPLDVRGTAFQKRVWQALREIPAGETATYSEIARRIGSPTAVRAVAQACAANNLAVAIPCHRVVRNDGSLSGYRWGIERKRELLGREQA